MTAKRKREQKHLKLYGEKIYESVYATETIVTKVFPELSSFAAEIHIFSWLEHPCLIKPIGWEFKTHDTSIIQFPRGESLSSAFRKGKITLEQIITDLICAVRYMHKRGYAHLDLRLCNVIYLNGRATLIDVGMCQKMTRDADGTQYVRGIAYTAWNRSPFYSARQWNPISCELYAIGCTIQDLLAPSFEATTETRTHDNPKINAFLDQCFDFKTLVQDASWPTPPDDQGLFKSDALPCPKSHFIPTMCWMSSLCMDLHLKYDVLILALHLMQTVNITNVPHPRVLGCICVHLATMQSVMHLHVPPSKWVTAAECSQEDYWLLFGQVLTAVNGQTIYTTFFDMAHSATHLHQLALDTMLPNYDPRLIRQFSSSANYHQCKFSKYICAVKQNDIDQQQNVVRTTPEPCKNILDRSFDKCLFWEDFDRTEEPFFGYRRNLLLHNKKQLKYALNKHRIEESVDYMITLSECLKQFEKQQLRNKAHDKLFKRLLKLKHRVLANDDGAIKR